MVEDLSKASHRILEHPAVFLEGDYFVAMDLPTKDVQVFSKFVVKQENDKRSASLLLRSWYRPSSPLQAKVTTVLRRKLLCAPGSLAACLGEWTNKSVHEHL